jgi:hypothetical protein
VPSRILIDDPELLLMAITLLVGPLVFLIIALFSKGRTRTVFSGISVKPGLILKSLSSG